MKFHVRAFTILFLVLLLPGCQLHIDVGAGNSSGHIIHVVCVWLKHGGDKTERAKILKAAEKFREIPGLIRMEKGECIPSQRPIVDSSYDVAFVMEFATIDDMNRYLAHPIHQAAANEILKPLAKKIVVYDFKS